MKWQIIKTWEDPAWMWKTTIYYVCSSRAIGDVFLSQENRPEAMDYFDMVLLMFTGLRPAELVEFKKNGVKVFEHSVHMFLTRSFAGNGIATGLCAGSVLGSRWREIFASKYMSTYQGKLELDLTEHVLSTDSADIYIGENIMMARRRL